MGSHRSDTQVKIKPRIMPRSFTDLCINVFIAVPMQIVPVFVLPGLFVYFLSGSKNLTEATLMAIYLMFVAFSVWGVTLSKEGIRFHRILGKPKLLPWDVIKSIEIAPRRELILKGWLWPLFPHREMSASLTSVGHYRISWGEDCYYYPPNDPEVFERYLGKYLQKNKSEAPKRVISPKGEKELPGKIAGRSDVYLEVPYPEKDEAKKMGAKWNAELKTWYAPSNLNPFVFAKWLPKKIKADIWALPNIYLATGKDKCPLCGELVSVYCLASDNYEYIEKDKNAEPPIEGVITYSYLKTAPKVLEKFFQLNCTSYFMDHSRTAETHYYMNHCSCGAKLGDNFLHSEPGGAFFPETEDEAKSIELRRITPTEDKLPLAAIPVERAPNLISDFAKRVGE